MSHTQVIKGTVASIFPHFSARPGSSMRLAAVTIKKREMSQSLKRFFICFSPLRLAGTVSVRPMAVSPSGPPPTRHHPLVRPACWRIWGQTEPAEGHRQWSQRVCNGLPSAASGASLHRAERPLDWILLRNGSRQLGGGLFGVADRKGCWRRIAWELPVVRVFTAGSQNQAQLAEGLQVPGQVLHVQGEA